jgi:chromosome segregation ATPase
VSDTSEERARGRAEDLVVTLRKACAEKDAAYDKLIGAIRRDMEAAEAKLAVAETALVEARKDAEDYPRLLQQLAAEGRKRGDAEQELRDIRAEALYWRNLAAKAEGKLAAAEQREAEKDKALREVQRIAGNEPYQVNNAAHRIHELCKAALASPSTPSPAHAADPPSPPGEPTERAGL